MENNQEKKPSSDKRSVYEIAHKEILGIRDMIKGEVLDYEGGDVKLKSPEERRNAQEKTADEKRKRPHSYYRDLIFSLIGVRLDEKRARTDWQWVLEHKYFMSEKLERNVGLRVAALDFYTNIKRNIKDTVMVNADTLADTVEQSITDGLTGAFNRRYFDIAMGKYFNHAKETGEVFCFLLLDVDFFKIYNDSNGHLTGDFALVEMVRILHAVTRPEDIVARYGGEEFGVIFPNIELSKAVNISESVRQSFADYLFTGENNLPAKNLTVSGGITSYSSEMPNYDTMIKEADNALYRAKHEGRNRIISWREIV